ncbi:MAG: alkaline phosphatase [Acidobacteria bacterium]|nr:alkaline phosphatase [Acidobacteriota bacterium]
MNIHKKRKLFSGAAALLLFLGVLLLLTGCGQKEASPKYVFLFIGDGMGPAQVHAAEIYLEASETGRIGIKRLDFSSFPVRGDMTTYAADAIVTDSASSSTAMFTGAKTRNGRINMDEAGEKKLKIITETVRETGRKIGVISNVSLDHATPAACYAHVPARSQYYDIALELGQSPVDFFGGGGLIRPTGRNSDQPDAVKLAEDNGFTVVDTKEAFLALKPGREKIIAFNERLTSDKAMPFEIDREKDDLPLSAYVKKAIELLDNPKGFFMMVESGKIDWACHDSDAGASIREVLAMDDAVREALAFYHRHPKKTLILITADHETGGLALTSKSASSKTSISLLGRQKMSMDRFTEEFIKPYFSSTQEADRSLHDLLGPIEEQFGLCVLTTDRKLILSQKAKEGDREAQIELDLSLTPQNLFELQAAFEDSSKKAFPLAIARIISAKAGLTWASDGHSALPVPVYAIGSGQELFNGCFDNTDLAKKMAALMGVSLESPEAPEKEKSETEKTEVSQ